MSEESEVSGHHELVIIKRHGGHGDEGHHGGAWKIAYADFMTAMMAFFLVMWLINSTDKKTLTQVATYFNPIRLTDKAPSSRGLSDLESADAAHKEAAQKDAAHNEAKSAPAGKVHAQKTTPAPEHATAPSATTAQAHTRPGQVTQSEEELFRDPDRALARIEAEAMGLGTSTRQAGDAFRDPFDPLTPRLGGEGPPDRGANGPLSAITTAPGPGSPQAASAPREAAKKLLKGDGGTLTDDAAKITRALKQALDPSPTSATPHVEVTATPEGILISVMDDYEFAMFAIASAEPRAELVKVMGSLAAVVARQKLPIVVRGHTDGRPFKAGTYDNWRLSSARAHMAYYMLVRGGVGPNQVERIEGHADRALKVRDDPKAPQNRRIEILLRSTTP